MPPPPSSIHGDPHSKSNSNLLSLFLKPIIMLLLTSLFFLFIGFAAFLLLHVFLLGGALHRLRFRHNPTRNLNTLPRFRVSGGSEPAPESRCVVCLDGFRNGQWCRKLADCGHVFHRRCVDTWLVKVAACPTCRTPVRINAEANVAAQDDRLFWNCANNTNAITMLL
ncbi:putative transcription factor C2H2 family [Lupinus albus]|uniref:Putative transcription factor C2H2 family n=1 Tax=Lupinus albus TaxID=3870 RepID=A0A6A4PLJ1_LUPAL|nr:putative transcription factor C2H2 family [Lupinus albus]